MGVYKEACKEWCKKPDSDKTWPNFKRYFAAAYADNLEETATTSMGYGTDTAQQQGSLMEVLEHLTNAALSDRAVLTNLTQANPTLTKQLEKGQKKIEAMKKKGSKRNLTILIISQLECIQCSIVGAIASL
eukprot:11178541-Ditylum_brightwellii.AAC.2